MVIKTPPITSPVIPTSPTASLQVSQAIAAQPPEIQQLNEKFVNTRRPHALLITNHGYPGPDTRWPHGGPDSGGQITYVNELAPRLVAEGFKVTIATRAFKTDQKYASFGQRLGAAFFSKEPLARYIYVPGIFDTFLPKEQIFVDLPAIGANLAYFLHEEAASVDKKPWEYIAWINSHYWDGGLIGQLLVQHWHQASALPLKKLNRHSWNAHSIGTLKEANMRREFDPEKGNVKLFEAQLAAMNFPIRERIERGLVGGAQHHELFPNLPAAAILVWTSEEIRDHIIALGKPDNTPLIHFPPGTDIRHYYPRMKINDKGVQAFFQFLVTNNEKTKKHGKQQVPESLIEEMKNNPQKFNVMVEASRMDDTKRKHIIIEAMQYLPKDTILFITGRRDDTGIYDNLLSRIDALNLRDRVFLLGFVSDEAMGPMQSLPQGPYPDQFRLAIGIGASRMEGWGMAVMDMTAGGMTLIASDMTPYASFLKNKDNAAVVIPVEGDEPRVYADAVLHFIKHPEEAWSMAERSLHIAQSLDWPQLIRNFLTTQGKKMEE